MGRAPCCDKANVKRGPWSPDEDAILKSYIESHGTGGNWITLPKKAGLKRCGKSCRLRWLNYLRPDIRHGGFTEDEDNIIFNLYNDVGSRWSVIASQLPGRTDNDIKNYWNTKLKKKILSGKINPSSNKAMDTDHPRGISPPELLPTLHYGSSSTSDSHALSSFPESLDIRHFGLMNANSLSVKPEIGPICSDFSNNNNVGSSMSTQECSSINSSNSPNSMAMDNGFGGSSGGQVDAWFGFSWDKIMDELLSDDAPVGHSLTDFAFH